MTNDEKRETLISVIKSNLEDLDLNGLKRVFEVLQYELRED